MDRQGREWSDLIKARKRKSLLHWFSVSARHEEEVNDLREKNCFFFYHKNENSVDLWCKSIPGVCHASLDWEPGDEWPTEK